MEEKIITAIKNKKLISLIYEGGSREIEPHCFGITTADNHAIRAFQVDGYSSSGKLGWKLFDLKKAEAVKVLDKSFDEQRPGYKRGDKGMKKIIAEL